MTSYIFYIHTGSFTFREDFGNQSTKDSYIILIFADQGLSTVKFFLWIKDKSIKTVYTLTTQKTREYCGIMQRQIQEWFFLHTF